MSPDFKDRLFEEHEVDYLIVRGDAVIRYTQPRHTKDIDLRIRPTPENARKVAKAFREFGIPVLEVSESDLAEKGLRYMVGVPPNAIDFLTTIKGLDFDEALKNRRVFETQHGRLLYLGIPDLLRAKHVMGRPLDLADVDEILRIHPDAESP